jgi:hypothetical protein
MARQYCSIFRRTHLSVQANSDIAACGIHLLQWECESSGAANAPTVGTIYEYIAEAVVFSALGRVSRVSIAALTCHRSFSIGLWRWYMGITITLLDISHHPSSIWKYDVSETGLYLRLQVEPTQMGLFCRLRTGTSCFSWAYLSRFHLKTKRMQFPKRRVLR